MDDISRFQKAEESPGFLLWQVTLLWRRKIEAILHPHGLTHVQFVLLAGLWYLTKDGKAITQKDVANFTRCDVTMTSQVLRSLEKKGLLIRQQKQGDERAKYPELTPAGLDKLKGAMKTVESVDQEFFDSLEGNLQEFRKCLQVLLLR